jgi:hypothetical protein
MQASKITLIGLLLFWMISATGISAQESFVRTAGGVTIYLGVVPAEIVKGPMHGRVPKGPHQYHVVAAIFDATTNMRIEDAAVTAQVSGLGLSGAKAVLEPMQIANTITYGAFFNLPGADLYTIRVSVQRPGSQQTVTVEFRYDHRRSSAHEGIRSDARKGIGEGRYVSAFSLHNGS